MTRTRVRASRLHAAALGGVAAVLVFAACETPHPTQITPVSTVDLLQSQARTESPPADPAQVRALLRSHFPEVLTQGTEEGTGSLSILLDGQDRVLEARVMEAQGIYQPSRVSLRRGEGAQVEPRVERRPAERAGDVEEVEIAPSRIRVQGAPAAGQVHFRTRSMLERVDPVAIASIEISHIPAGELGPDELRVLVVKLKGDFVEAPRGALRQRTPLRAGEPGGTFELAPESGELELVPVPAPGGRAMLPSRTRREGEPGVSAARVAEVRAALERHHPAALRGGIPADRPVWFVLDARGRIVKTGQAPDEPFAGEVDEGRVDGVEVIKAPALGVDGGGGVIWFRLKP